MHFNAKNRQDSSTTNPSINNTRLTPIDILTIDKNSRLTLTKKVKKILSLNPKDEIMVYQDTYNKNILLKIQHDESATVSNWILTTIKENLKYIDNNENVQFKSNSYNKNNITIDILTYDKFNTTTEIDTRTKNNTETEEYHHRHNIEHKEENTLYNTPILLVDDEPDLITTFDFFLKNEGYKNIITFSESKNVLKHLSDINPSYYKLAIMDIRMPYINGIQLYQILKILNPFLKIIFVTALDAVNELSSIYSEIKPSDIMRKPITPDQFVKTVNDKISQIGI